MDRSKLDEPAIGSAEEPETQGRDSLSLPDRIRRLTTTQPCTVTARHIGFLGAQWVIDQPGATRWVLPKVTLLGGDTNGDGRINILDIAYIGARFESQDTLADLNADGRVNILDLVLAASNFGQSSNP